MSTSIVDAWAEIKARATATVAGRVLYALDSNELPDETAPFAFFDLVTERGAFIEIGGGRGANRYRHVAELHGYAFVPRGWGMSEVLASAETIAAAFRSHKGGGITCDGASVHPVGEGETLAPAGVSSIAGNYSCAVAVIPLHFDQTG